MNAIITNMDLSGPDLSTFAPAAFASHASPLMSSKYTFLPTSTAITALEAEGFHVASAKQARTRREDGSSYAKHMIRMRKGIVGGDVEVVPEVCLANAHNGGGAFKAYGGAFRSFCFNGLMISEGVVEAVAIRHTGDRLQDLIDGVNRVMLHAQETVRALGDWRGVHLAQDAQLELARRALEMRWPLEDGKSTTVIQPQQLLEVRRNEDVGDDLWHVFNRVQESIITGGSEYTSVRIVPGGTRVRRLKVRAVKGIDSDIKLNRDLWALAEEFALQAA